MCVYIKKNVKGIYVTLPEALTEEKYNNLGTDYSDYLNNKWVMLNEEQIAFHEANPKASVKEVWNCQLDVVEEPVRTIEDAKHDMLQKINNYDDSKSVNNFYVNGDGAWFTASERNNHKQSIDSAKIIGVETLSLFINDKLITVPTASAEQMLAQIQLYADNCFIVTKQHKLAVEELAKVEIEYDENNQPTEESKTVIKLAIEAIDSYDYTTGYPSMLNFEV